MRLPRTRGPLSRWCAQAMTDRRPSAPGDVVTGPQGADPLADDDLQLALWMLYESHYAGFDAVSPALEWDPVLLAVRGEIERTLEAALRERTRGLVEDAVQGTQDVAEAIFGLCAQDTAPSVAAYAHHSANHDQLLELLMHRSVYQLKEADPHTWMVPRLRGRAKTSLLQIQYDEYGAGRPGDVHATLFADTLTACGLDPGYGAYVDVAPGTTLAMSNTASMLGLHRRLRGAAAGHLAAVEATSSSPSAMMWHALRRHGCDEQATRFFDEHIEADAVHEQLAARGLCASLVEESPEMRRDVLFGATACLLVEGQFAEAVLHAWAEGRSSLYTSGAAADRGAIA